VRVVSSRSCDFRIVISWAFFDVWLKMGFVAGKGMFSSGPNRCVVVGFGTVA